MITVLKHGKRDYERTCPRCGCIFTFWKEDMRCDPKETEQENGFDIDIDLVYSIDCPDCGRTIEVEIHE